MSGPPGFAKGCPTNDKISTCCDRFPRSWLGQGALQGVAGDLLNPGVGAVRP